MQAFAKRLRTLRQKCKLTQAELAERCGLHINQLARYETGKAQPMMQAIQRLCIALNCSADELLFDQPGKSLPPSLQQLLHKVAALPKKGQIHIHTTVEALIKWFQ